MSSKPYHVTRDTMLRNPGASDWLKRAVLDLEKRDPIDAQLDAAYLVKLMQSRADEVLERAQHMISPGNAYDTDTVVPFGTRK